MSNASEKRDPDEVRLAPNAGVGGAGRIPIYGRVGDGVSDEGEPARVRIIRRDEDEVQPATDEADEYFNFSIEASIQSNHIAWRDMCKLKGVLLALPDSPTRTHARNIAEVLDLWFENEQFRLRLMLNARDNAGGEK